MKIKKSESVPYVKQHLNEVLMRLLITVLFLVFFGSISEAADSGDLRSGAVKFDGHSIKNFALEQSKRVTEQIGKFGPCYAMSGALVWTCRKSKEDPQKIAIGKEYMTIDQIVDLGTYYKKHLEKEQNKVVNPEIK